MDYKTRLTIMDSIRTTKGTSLRTGVNVPESGIYRVLHSQHSLPDEVMLLKDQQFPRCSRCSELVLYELVRPAPAASSYPGAFTVTLYELPELLPDDELAG